MLSRLRRACLFLGALQRRPRSRGAASRFLLSKSGERLFVPVTFLAIVIVAALLHTTPILAPQSPEDRSTARDLLEAQFPTRSDPGPPPAIPWLVALVLERDGSIAVAAASYIPPLAPESPLTLPAAATPLPDLVLDLRQAPPPLPPTYLAPREPVILFVHQGDLTLRLSTTRVSVGSALTAHQLRLGSHDYVTPLPTSAVTPGMHVYIYRAKRISIVDGEVTATFYTTAETVAQALRQANIALGESDRVEPDLESRLGEGTSVTVIRVEEAVITVAEALPYTTVYRNDPGLEEGETLLLQAGREGTRYRRVQIIYENGSEVARRLLDSWLEPAPQPAIVAQGTYTPVKTLETPDGVIHYVRTLRVLATWYNASDGGRPPDDPSYGLTATGIPVDKGIIAVDPNVIPLGTRLYIPGYGPAVAADTGGGVVGNHIDLGFPEGITPDWQTGWVTIYILAP